VTYAHAFNIIGLLMNLLGVILLFAFGMPFGVRTGGHLFRLFEQPNPKDVRLEHWCDLLGLLGLMLIVLGTAAQIKATFLS
jgi:hypothetical protein